MSQRETRTNEKVPDCTCDDLAALVAALTTDQVRFIVSRQEHSTDKDAAEAVGISPSTVKNWKSAGVPIDETVKLMAADGLVVARNVRRRNLAKAMLVKVAGLDEDDPRVRQNVATEIIEWEMGKATQKSEITGADGGPLRTEDVTLTDSERMDRLAAIVTAAREG